MELRHLRYFTAVVECKGYREAPRRLHIAQLSISEAVSDLEHELGLKLFSRTHRAARLRPEGVILCGRRTHPSTGGDCHPHCQAGGPRQSWEAFDRVYRFGNALFPA
jgi:hypothetical protein